MDPDVIYGVVLVSISIGVALGIYPAFKWLHKSGLLRESEEDFERSMREQRAIQEALDVDPDEVTVRQTVNNLVKIERAGRPRKSR